MSRKGPIKDMGASVRARLLQLARGSGETVSALLIRFVLERWLYRLSVSRYADDFVVKGATLFSLWSPRPHRLKTKSPSFGFDLAPVGTNLRSLGSTLLSARFAFERSTAKPPCTV